MGTALLASINCVFFIQGERIQFKCGRAKEISCSYSALSRLVVAYQWQQQWVK